MSNPFAQLQVYDQEDEDYQQRRPQDNKKVPQKKVKDTAPAPRFTSNANDIQGKPLKNQNKDQFTKSHKHHERPVKQLPTGHVLDRQSGTGRVDKPRKQGGGRGNIGDLHDLQNKDKYIKEGQENQEQTEQVEEVKPQEPQGMTLSEYYQSKGIQLQEIQRKAPVKKQEINADWIKKEKLTLIESKEDKKLLERNKVQVNKNQLQPGANSNEEANSLLGFHSKPSFKPSRREDEPREQREHRQPREHRQHREPREHKEPRQPRETREPRENRGNRDTKDTRVNKGNADNRDNRDNRNNDKGGKKKEKVVINEDDFPTL